MSDVNLSTNEFADLIERRRYQCDEMQRLDSLVKQYRAQMPSITAQWDTTEEAVQHNDIDSEFVAAGIAVYECSMSDLWQGIYEPSIYDSNTLWSRNHDSRKIAKVIEAWEAGIALSPIFLVKHRTKDFGLVADGKHRLTVSRAIQTSNMMPFMVMAENSGWVVTTFPAAVRIS